MRRVGFAELRRRADTRQPSTHCHDTSLQGASRAAERPAGWEARRAQAADRKGAPDTRLRAMHDTNGTLIQKARLAYAHETRGCAMPRRLMVHKDAQICSGEISRSRQHTVDAIRRRARKARSVAPKGTERILAERSTLRAHYTASTKVGPVLRAHHTLSSTTKGPAAALIRGDQPASASASRWRTATRAGVGKPQVLLLSPPLLLGSSAFELAPAPCSPSGSGAVGARVRCSCR